MDLWTFFELVADFHSARLEETKALLPSNTAKDKTIHH